MIGNKDKKEIIEEGVLMGLKHFTQYSMFVSEDGYSNPIHIFSNIMSQKDMIEFTKKLYSFMFDKYEKLSIEELKVMAVRELFEDVKDVDVAKANNNIIVSYISKEVVSKINDIYSKLQKQSEIILKELDID